jgi:hypothetical protein
MSDNRDNFLKKIILEQLNWNRLLRFFPYFSKNPTASPKALKNSIEERIESDLSHMDMHKISNVFSSSEFLMAFSNLIQKFFIDNPNDSIGIYYDQTLKQSIMNLVTNIKVYLPDSIKTTKILKLTQQKLCETEHTMLVINDKKRKFLIKEILKDDLEFYVSLMISKEMKNLLMENENDLRVKFFIETLQQRDRLFLHFLVKLIKSSTNCYETILDQVNLGNH